MDPKRFARDRMRSALGLHGGFTVRLHAAEDLQLAVHSQVIKGRKDYVYVWTLGVEGRGARSDKLVTVDVNPKSKSYGKVLHRFHRVRGPRR